MKKAVVSDQQPAPQAVVATAAAAAATGRSDRSPGAASAARGGGYSDYRPVIELAVQAAAKTGRRAATTASNTAAVHTYSGNSDTAATDSEQTDIDASTDEAVTAVEPVLVSSMREAEHIDAGSSEQRAELQQPEYSTTASSSSSSSSSSAATSDIATGTDDAAAFVAEQPVLVNGAAAAADAADAAAADDAETAEELSTDDIINAWSKKFVQGKAAARAQAQRTLTDNAVAADDSDNSILESFAVSSTEQLHAAIAGSFASYEPAEHTADEAVSDDVNTVSEAAVEQPFAEYAQEDVYDDVVYVDDVYTDVFDDVQEQRTADVATAASESAWARLHADNELYDADANSADVVDDSRSSVSASIVDS
eukprot:128-Heterococcus_DN1.PRE.1